MNGSLDSLNSVCRSFSNLKTVTVSRPKETKVPSVKLRSVQLFWIVWQFSKSTYDSLDWIGPFDSLKFEKKWDCRSFSDFITLTGCRSFRHSDEVTKRKHKRGNQVMWAEKAHPSSNPGWNLGSIPSSNPGSILVSWLRSWLESWLESWLRS